jgi:hypothetical protein
MSANTPQEVGNEQAIRSLYALAEGNAKDTFKFVSMFTDDGYFYDVAADKKYFGRGARGAIATCQHRCVCLTPFLHR